MGTDIVEVVAGNDLSCQRVVGETKALTHIGLVEVCLESSPTSRWSVGDARILFDVEALFRTVVADGR